MYRNRKGFTIVELVIVIAVIAILAAVLIPTFSSLTQKRLKKIPKSLYAMKPTSSLKTDFLMRMK